jgi:adenylate kinase family enzyme
MGNGILIYGESGTGKTTSCRNLEKASTYIINVQGKQLPWKGSKNEYSKELKNLKITDSALSVLNCLKAISDMADAKHIKTVILDDFQYLMVNELMRKASSTGYQKFTDIAVSIWSILESIKSLRDDLTIIVLAHSETTSTGKEKIKTVGKMLDDQVNIEGMFTVVLKALKHQGQYVFSTVSNGFDTVKSPIGMFESDYIPNDLKTVIEAVNNY